MPSFGFCGASYTSESPNQAASKTVNWYPEAAESASVSPIAMYPSPGLEPFAAVAGNAVRGMYEFNGRLFAVGDNFAEIFADGHTAGYSFLPVDNNPVSMAANNAGQLIICTGGQLWLFPLTAGSIIYNNVPSTISTVQIVDTGSPTTLDYYIDTTLLAGYAIGSSLLFAGVTGLTFLNGVTGTILGIAANQVFMQLPRTLSQGFFQAINNINVFISTASSGTPQLAPTLVDQILAGSGISWANPSGIIGSGSSATAHFPNLSGPGFSDVLRGYAYGFALPTGATVEGIQIDFEIQSSSTSVITQNVQAQIYKSGLPVGSVPGTPVPSSAIFQTVTFGSPTDLWGTTWTASEINDLTFGLGLQVIVNYAGGTFHLVQLRNYLVTITWSLTIYSATVTFTSTWAPFNDGGQLLTFSGLTLAPALNGNSYPLSSSGGNMATVVGVPGPAVSGAETGGATGNVNNWGPATETGTVSGTVISTSVNPVQVAIGQGPFIQVDFVDGYFVALRTNSQVFQISGLEDGTTWDPIDSFQVLQYADNIMSMIVNQRQIWFLGPKRTLVYYDTGDALIPFQPIPGAFIEQGISAQWSLCRMDNSIVWVSRDERGQAMAFRANGYTPERISNHAVENAWRQYVTVSDAIAYTYQENGHTLWQIWFPTANTTWVYDAATHQWHEKAFLQNGVLNAHRSRSQAFSFGRELVGDRASGTIYSMEIANLSDNVDGIAYPIQRTRAAIHLSNEQKWTFHQQMQVYLEPGLGPSGGFPGGQPTGPTYYYFQDPNGINWQMHMPDAGVFGVAVSLGPGTAPSPIYLLDLALLPNIVVYLMGIDIAGNGTLTLVPDIRTGYSERFPISTFPSGLQTYISVQNGSFVVDTPFAPTRGPQILLRWSDDGGHQWSNYYPVSAGNYGDWRVRCMWRRLGRSRDRIYEIQCSDPIPWRIVDAYLQVQPGP